MIRRADPEDRKEVEEMFREHFDEESEHGALTVFRRGVYPTGRDMEQAIRAGSLYVAVEDGGVCGIAILNRCQPEEYQGVRWGSGLPPDRVMVLHLLMVRPGCRGRGIARSLIGFAVETAKRNGCGAIRLDTGVQNTPAVSLYEKTGFRIAAQAPMMVGGSHPARGASVSGEDLVAPRNREGAGGRTSDGKESGGFSAHGSAAKPPLFLLFWTGYLLRARFPGLFRIHRW